MSCEPTTALAEMHRVPHPGGRGVFTVGFRLDPARATGRRSTARLWDWIENDNRELVEGAGFTDVSVSYARIASADRIDELIQRAIAGTQEVRIVSGLSSCRRARRDAAPLVP